MPRAYFRTLPDLYERKALGIVGKGEEARDPYPPDAFVAFMGALCLGEQQSPRGVFKSERLLRVLLEGPGGQGKRYARQVPYLIKRNDLVRASDGSLSIEGWPELQEGNWQVAERMVRYRGRKPDVTPPTVTPVTPDTVTPVTPPTVTVPSERMAEGGERLAEGHGVTPHPVDDDDQEEADAIQWLARHQATLKPTGDGYHQRLVTLIGRHGSAKVIATFERISESAHRSSEPRPTLRQYLFGADDLLDSVPRLNGKAAADTERQAVEAARAKREEERSRKLINDRLPPGATKV